MIKSMEKVFIRRQTEVIFLGNFYLHFVSLDLFIQTKLFLKALGLIITQKNLVRGLTEVITLGNDAFLNSFFKLIQINNQFFLKQLV
jgi:hypothetical protein